jgi:phosphoribosylamine--glycine ligase
MASGGYPGDFEKGRAIHGLVEAAKIDDLIVFHAGTAARDGKVVNAGGRVLGVTGLGETVAAAIDKAYQGVRAITWEGAHYRTDIGKKALGRG